jgi:hypothetical protein
MQGFPFIVMGLFVECGSLLPLFLLHACYSTHSEWSIKNSGS